MPQVAAADVWQIRVARAKRILGFRELMQTSVGDPFERADLNKKFLIVGWWQGRRLEKRENGRIHTAPKKRLGLQRPELPRPQRVGIAETQVLSIGFLLAALQIALEKGFIGPLKNNLRAIRTSTGEPAAQSQQCRNGKCYGVV